MNQITFATISNTLKIKQKSNKAKFLVEKLFRQKKKSNQIYIPLFITCEYIAK